MSGGPADRPDPADVVRLAELDAGLPDEVTASAHRAAAGPRSAAVLDALAATRARLADLPAPPLPPSVTARWADALAAEAGDAARVSQVFRLVPALAPRGTARSRLRRPLLAAAALVALAAAGLGVPVSRDRAPDTLTLTRVDLVAAATAAVGTTDVGDLADPARRAGCLRVVAPAAVPAPLLGGRRVVLDGRPGVLLVLGTGALGRFRLVVVDPGCGPAGGILLADTPVG